MRKYKLLSKKGEGTFAEVFQAKNISNDRLFAIKCMKRQFTDVNQVNNLREVQALRRLAPHPNIVGLEEVLYDRPTGRLALVFELLDRTLLEIIQPPRPALSSEHVAAYMYQLFRALEHMHSRGIFHRDIKPENVLLARRSDGVHILKVADYGSCRGIYSRQPYTDYISTRWYRSPEVLLTNGFYGAEMDAWAAGCVMFETLSQRPLFPGGTEIEMISRIRHVLGTPPEALRRHNHHGVDWSRFRHVPGVGINSVHPDGEPAALALVAGMVTYDVEQRFSARDALDHHFFRILTRTQRRRLDEDLVASPAPSPPPRPSVSPNLNFRGRDSGSSASPIDTPSRYRAVDEAQARAERRVLRDAEGPGGPRRQPRGAGSDAGAKALPREAGRRHKKAKAAKAGVAPSEASTPRSGQLAPMIHGHAAEAKAHRRRKPGHGGQDAERSSRRQEAPSSPMSAMSVHSLPSVRDGKSSKATPHSMRYTEEKEKALSGTRRRRRRQLQPSEGDVEASASFFPPIGRHGKREPSPGRGSALEAP